MGLLPLIRYLLRVPDAGLSPPLLPVTDRFQSHTAIRHVPAPRPARRKVASFGNASFVDFLTISAFML